MQALLALVGVWREVEIFSAPSTVAANVLNYSQKIDAEI
jgi:hypothetical protein